MTYENIDSLLVRMRADLTTLQARRDARRFFHATYLRTTRAVARLLRPANRAAGRRFLAEARGKVWRNAAALDQARRAGATQYASVLAELERRCAARVLDLTAPGPVLLALARRGFGVLLPGA